MAQRSLAKRLWYDLWWFFCRMFAIALFRVRVRGLEHVPKSGGLLVLSNHQSHFDPVLVGLACDRRLNFLARETLFGCAPVRWLIQSFDTIPLDREGGGLSGLKESLRRLKQEEPVLIFPEGTRTKDGEVAALKPGFCALARRAKVSLLPVGIAGAFEAWPRTAILPGLAVIHVQWGKALPPDEVAALDDESLVAEIERRIRECHAAAQENRRRAVHGPL